MANAGDSRAVLGYFDTDGSMQARPLSTDHKPKLESEKLRIKAAGGTVEEGSVCGFLSVSRSLGIIRFKANYEIEPKD